MQSSRRSVVRRNYAVIAGAASLALVASLSLSAAGTTTAPGASPSTATVSLNKTAASQAPSADIAKVPNNVRFYQFRRSLLGTHRWYQQIKNDKPVVGGWWGWHRNTETGAITIWDGRKSVNKVNTSTPTLTLDKAIGTATKASSTAARFVTVKRLMVFASRDRGARLVWAISSADGSGARTSYVDAVNGAILKTVVNVKFAHHGKVTGTARVFDPNPVEKLQDESLTDQGDSDAAVPLTGYSVRDLAHLNASHSLAGRWARVMNRDRATSSTNTYKYRRHDDRFEQVMAYYSIDREESYLQRLGFTDVNAEPQKIVTNTIPDDNSFYDPSTDMITMGRGGVDDAEDPEVIWHENGHAIQDDQVPNWGQTEQGGAIGEGFGDYMGVTMSQEFGMDTTKTPTACVMDWDSTSYTRGVRPHCLRRTDGTKNFPGDLDGEVHDDGEIWSSAIYAINSGKAYSLGRNKATKIIVEAQFWMNPQVKFKAAAQITVDTAALLYPNQPQTWAAVQSAFADRGIITVAPPKR